MSKIIFVYIVCKNKAEAKKIGSSLVKERLAACVNIFDKMYSVYWWKGRMEHTSETVLIAKTTKQLFDRLSKKVKSIHSYSMPCIVRLDIAAGDRNYFKWLAGSVKQPLH
jgi:periplasmic divalent cation tolerance protein